MKEAILELFDDFLLDAENLFGKSNNDWTYNGIEFNDYGPNLLYYPEGYVTISLSKKAINDPIQRAFQLSHEVCHLLHPSRDYPTLILNKTLTINEGISTYFSIYKSSQLFNNKIELVENLKTYSPNYYNAYLLVDELMNIDRFCIKKLRLKKKKVDKLTISDFDALDSNISQNLKENLLEVFKQTSP